MRIIKMFELLKKFAFLFALFVSLPIVLFAQGSYQRSSLWEKEIAAFTAADQKNFPKKGKVLFVGSSSIRAWRTLQEDFPSIYPINRGFGGSHFEDVNYYASQIVFPYKPKLIVLYAGENDLVAGKSVTNVFGDFKKFVSLLKENLPAARVIVISAKPSPARWKFTRVFKELNSLMKTETEKNKNLLFVDVWLPMLNSDGEPRKDIFLGDDLHLNPAGYKIWREILDPAIKSGLRGSFR